MDKNTISEGPTKKSEAHYGSKDAGSEYRRHSTVRPKHVLLIPLLCNSNVSNDNKQMIAYVLPLIKSHL